MKLPNSILSFTLSSFLAVNAWAAAGVSKKIESKYPRVSEVSGKAIYTDRDGKVLTLRKSQRLIEKASVETMAAARVTVELDAVRRVQLFANSRIDIPAISWETGEAPTVVLKQGTVRWKQPSEGSYSIALTSDLFEFTPPVGDYVFSFDPKTAIAEVKVVQGQLSFSATHAEEVADVSTGQKCKFFGVKEGGEIVYDVLLQGKKIPRGKLGPVETFSAEEKRLYSAETLKKEAEAVRRQEKAAAVARENAKDPLQICAKPAARLNQCVWVCENNPAKEKKTCRLDKPGVQCLRKRCNANGEWAEATEISQERGNSVCGATAKVKDCDY